MKESEIRPAHLLSRYHELTALDASRMNHSRFVEVECPGCASSGVARFKFRKNGFSYVQCSNCNSLCTTSMSTVKVRITGPRYSSQRWRNKGGKSSFGQRQPRSARSSPTWEKGRRFLSAMSGLDTASFWKNFGGFVLSGTAAPLNLARNLRTCAKIKA